MTAHRPLKLSVENFARFKNSEFIFNTGVTVVVGENDSGKSSLLSALGRLAYAGVSSMSAYKDLWGTHIRTGENYFKLLLEDADGVVLRSCKMFATGVVHELKVDFPFYVGEHHCYSPHPPYDRTEYDANLALSAAQRFMPDLVELTNDSQGRFSAKFADGTVQPFSRLGGGVNKIVGIIYEACKVAKQVESRKGSIGLVLIENVDNYLHPNVQKTLLPTLRELFPTVRFIVETHSPFIVQSVAQGEVINLDGGIEDSVCG
jgi:predicted ATP-dependent endonuclease of OLD family